MFVLSVADMIDHLVSINQKNKNFLICTLIQYAYVLLKLLSCLDCIDTKWKIFNNIY